jgi:hypothetical protein
MQHGGVADDAEERKPIWRGQARNGGVGDAARDPIVVVVLAGFVVEQTSCFSVSRVTMSPA